MAGSDGRRADLLPLYVWSVSAAGAAVVVWAAQALWRDPVPHDWLIFAALTVASSFLTLKIPAVPAHLSVSEIFAFTCVLLFGPAAGTVTLAADGLLHSLRRRHRLHQCLFNAANLSLAVFASSSLFFAAAGVRPLYVDPVPLSGLMGPLLLLTVVYFLINSGLTAVAVAFEAGESPFKVWREYFSWVAVSYFAAGSAAALLVMALQSVHFSAILLTLPLLVISFVTLRSSLGRIEDARRHVAQVDRLYVSTIETLASAIDASDSVTHKHIRRVQIAAVALAREVGVTDPSTLKAIEAAALLHDTGKLAIPEHILNKPGKLTPAEFERMKQHAPIGAEILSSIEFPFPVVPIVRHHHENWDGTGYPDGLAGEAIPIGARILAVVDCFDALTSDRPYRPRLSDEQALRILVERRGTMYDPAIVDAFVRTYERIMPREAPSHPAARIVEEARAAAEPAPVPEAPAVP
ncbi:MAG TPA: HD domain-containing phosphohydrolase, partial [Vicinamibacterales bacterium]|nr:HD domain-containing phosphohydrolase [Vicinamibacterales bacterium]